MGLVGFLYFEPRRPRRPRRPQRKKLAHLAAGQLDSVMHELGLRGRDVRSEYPISIRYKEVILDRGYRADPLVDEYIFVENKTVEGMYPVHRAQLLTYLKLIGHSIGFLNIFFAVFAVFAVFLNSSFHSFLAIQLL
jgi:GxxExxY protein